MWCKKNKPAIRSVEQDAENFYIYSSPNTLRSTEDLESVNIHKLNHEVLSAIISNWITSVARRLVISACGFTVSFVNSVLCELIRCFLIRFLVWKALWHTGQGTTTFRSWTPATCSLRWPLFRKCRLHWGQRKVWLLFAFLTSLACQVFIRRAQYHTQPNCLYISSSS